MKKNSFLIIAFIILISCNFRIVFGHGDTMDGPVVADAKKAIEQNNVNYVLKWVFPESEQEIKDVFGLIMKVRELSPEAMEISDRYFFETLVRLHRSDEGMPFTGVKPSGTPIDEKILAADKSIDIGNLSPLEELVPEDKMPELKERFERVMSLKNFDVSDVTLRAENISKLMCNSFILRKVKRENMVRDILKKLVILLKLKRVVILRNLLERPVI